MGCGSSGAASSAANSAAKVRMWMGDRYELGEKIGEGGFAQVRAAWLRYPREQRAIKLIYMKDAEVCTRGKKSSLKVDREKRRMAKREVAVWRHVGEHEHVVRLFEAFSKDCIYYMVMEKCERTLMGFLLQMPHTKECDMRRIFQQMLFGIEHLHSVQIVHADIKLSNYLLGGPDGTTIKLCDFGLAEQIPEDGSRLDGQVGTDMYMSPEMVNEEGFTLSTDMWSLGVAVYLLLHGDFPYPDNSATGSGKPEPRFQRCDGLPDPSNGAATLARRLLVRGQESRCSAREALALPWLVGGAGTFSSGASAPLPAAGAESGAGAGAGAAPGGGGGGAAIEAVRPTSSAGGGATCASPRGFNLSLASFDETPPHLVVRAESLDGHELDDGEDQEGKLTTGPSLACCFERVRLLTTRVEMQTLDPEAQRVLDDVVVRARNKAVTRVVTAIAGPGGAGGGAGFRRRERVQSADNLTQRGTLASILPGGGPSRAERRTRSELPISALKDSSDSITAPPLRPQLAW